MRNFKHQLEADIALQERLLVQYENELKRLPEEAEASKLEMDLPDVVVPDFVFTLPSGEKIYWEHLGMLGVKKYSVQWLKKLIFYHWLGITQGVNLIITADDCNGVIDPAAVADIIETKLAPLITKPRRH